MNKIEKKSANKRLSNNSQSLTKKSAEKSKSSSQLLKKPPVKVVNKSNVNVVSSPIRSENEDNEQNESQSKDSSHF